MVSNTDPDLLMEGDRVQLISQRDRDTLTNDTGTLLEFDDMDDTWLIRMDDEDRDEWWWCHDCLLKITYIPIGKTDLKGVL